MGSYLNKPKTDKESEDMENDLLMCGVSSMQGWREKQEDAHVCLVDFDDDMSLFGVFDGHGGAEVAQYAVEMLPSLIKNELFEQGEYEKALVKAYMDFDDSLIEPPVLRRLRTLRLKNGKTEESDNGDVDEKKLVETELAGKDSGCTAVVALLVKNKLYVANAGDSRCVVSIGGKAHAMSKDHKPRDKSELKRILAAGGRVSSDGRINHGLNMSRALGDHMYKTNSLFPNTKQMITALPDVQAIDLTPENGDFIVLACDGIWNSLCSQKAVDFISNRIHCPDVKLSLICEELFEVCLAPDTPNAGVGCDNMTCIIVKFKHHQKRSLTDDVEEESDLVTDCKKPKLDVTAPESVD
ncbi:probable protein phosphatase CG10417 isoform X2 [Acyrthosiphon pisum]|uniref:protein-serine/threonine phosphatase n=1 Tax=Acyrthosiphon pisum TaxID=7029 RepID=A0A8R2H3Y3_ACYPI|nr:probable protein phosphatase CG10417 isoform X2 [Acyrthosiphon pisum]|eukprot:XP_016657313.1 PREDICTED: probable protein phosphatase CG10417 isoform X2 [Acyrthosiphon pisum]